MYTIYTENGNRYRGRNLFKAIADALRSNTVWVDPSLGSFSYIGFDGEKRVIPITSVTFNGEVVSNLA